MAIEAELTAWSAKPAATCPTKQGGEVAEDNRVAVLPENAAGLGCEHGEGKDASQPECSIELNLIGCSHP